MSKTLFKNQLFHATEVVVSIFYDALTRKFANIPKNITRASTSEYKYRAGSKFGSNAVIDTLGGTFMKNIYKKIFDDISNTLQDFKDDKDIREAGSVMKFIFNNIDKNTTLVNLFNNLINENQEYKNFLNEAQENLYLTEMNLTESEKILRGKLLDNIGDVDRVNHIYNEIVLGLSIFIFTILHPTEKMPSSGGILYHHLQIKYLNGIFDGCEDYFEELIREISKILSEKKTTTRKTTTTSTKKTNKQVQQIDKAINSKKATTEKKNANNAFNSANLDNLEDDDDDINDL